MLTRRVIACLDVRDGRVVKGVKFADLRTAGDPAALAARYDAEGADEIVVLDVSATLEGRRAIADTVRAVADRVFVPLTVGGGVRSIDDARALVDAGADKVSINSAALARPALIAEIASLFGSQAVVVAIDAIARGDRFEVRSRSGSSPDPRDAVAWAREAVGHGAGEILLTSIDRDGTQSGFDCDLTRAVSGAVPVPVIASGGAGRPGHFVDVFLDGCADAALAASILHFEDYGVRDLKRFLADRGVPIRLDDADSVD
ncbi:MAG TPA: imidazole glycerol phosphate synthase subunit HisF [Vicinamibacterales bacterium]|nr:imidazole glycerol phosphate synthase subunit HisF [Vicinamibacterales bacterium]